MTRPIRLTRPIQTVCAGLLLAGAFALVASPGPSSAEGVSESLRTRVERALSHHEKVPTREELLALSPQVEGTLLEIIRSPSKRALARSRAITVLRSFPGTAAASTLAEVIRRNRGAKPGVALLDLEEALVSHAFVAGPASVALARPFLAHENEDVRLAAVDAIGLSRSAEAVALLKGRRTVEPSLSVKKRIEKRLDLLARAAAKPGAGPSKNRIPRP